MLLDFDSLSFVQHLARSRRRNRPALENDYPVYITRKRLRHTDAVVRTSPHADSSGIENSDIGPHPRPKQTTILQTETLSGKRRHLSNCLFERDRSPLTNIYREDPSERAVASWMWVRLSKIGISPSDPIIVAGCLRILSRSVSLMA